MSRFRDFFGRATITKLDRTFRFNDKIALVSGQFIQKNPKQIRKTLQTQVRCESPQVFLHWAGSNTGNLASNAALENVVCMLRESLHQESPSLLILSRYNHLLPDRSALKALERIWPGQIRPPSPCTDRRVWKPTT